MKRVITKIGDIFSAKVDDHTKKFFQLIAFDLTQLNSDVVRAFKSSYPIDENPNFSVIVNDDVQFYAHCAASVGVKLGYWEKVGNCQDLGEIEHIRFRTTPDYGTMPGQEPVLVSSNWYVWHINDLDFTHVGRLEGKNRDAHIGLVMSPVGIIELLKGRRFPPRYPTFE